MVEGAITTLILICVVVLIVYVALWVLQQIGVPLPEQVIKVLWVIVALVCLLLLLRWLLPAIGVKASISDMFIASAEARPKKVRIHKPSPPYYDYSRPADGVALVALAPAAVAFDLAR